MPAKNNQPQKRKFLSKALSFRKVEALGWRRDSMTSVLMKAKEQGDTKLQKRVKEEEEAARTVYASVVMHVAETLKLVPRRGVENPLLAACYYTLLTQHNIAIIINHYY